MQKNIIAKIFAITIAVSCMLTGFFVVSGKKVNAAETYTVIEQLPDAERFVINKVSYRQGNITNSNLTFEGASNQTNVFNMSAALSPDNNVAKGEDVMLNNYGNNQSTDSYEMLLISFGDINGSYNADMTKVLYTHIVSVTLDVNGNSYDISTSDNYFGGKAETGYTNYPSLTDQDLGLQLGSNKMVETSNIVTSQFTTLLDLNALGINSLTEEGHYTISFNFSYMVCDYVDGQESNPQVVNNVKYVYDFYLFSNTNFAQQYKDYNNYPEFLGYNINESNDANDFVISPEGTMTYYDYNNRLLSPTLQYDAENYNLSYTKKRTTTDTYTTVLTNGTEDTKILTTYKNGNFAFYQELSPTVIDGVKRYIVNYDFSDMSTYNLHFAYQIKADNGYRILDNEGYTAVMYNGKSSLKGEILHPDQAILHVYGVRTYMTGAKPTFFAQDGYTFNADFTARYYLYSTIGTIDNTHLYASMYDYWNDADLTKEYQYDSTSDMLFPEINLSSLYFDVYGVANFEDNQPTSTITRYSNLDDMIAGVDEDNVSLGTTSRLYLDSTIGEETGYYVVKVDIKFNERSNDAHYTQYFVFARVSGEPKVSIHTIDQNSSTQNLISPFYTNKDVVFSIGYDSHKESGNDYIGYLNYQYFCKPYIAEIYYGGENYASNYTLITDNIISYSPYGGANANATRVTNSGRYRLVVKYGSSGLGSNSYSFIIDKDPIDKVNAYNVSLTLDEQHYVRESIANTTTNKIFALGYDSKASGASIVVEYKKYELQSIKDYAQLYSMTGSSITAISTNYKIDFNNVKNIFDNQNVEWDIYKYLFDGSNNNYEMNSVLRPSVPTIYYFRLTDQAGNTTYLIHFFDNSTPYAVFEPQPTNNYNIVSSETSLIWANRKGILIENYQADPDYPISTLIFSNVNGITNNYGVQNVQKDGTYAQMIFNSLDNVDASFTVQQENGQNLTEQTSYNPLAVNKLVYYPEGETNIASAIFAGEGNIDVTITDALGNSYDTNIEMNLDNSLGLVYAKNSSDSTITRINTLNTTIINDQQLYFSYLNDVPGYELGEGDVQYMYFPIDQYSYANVNSLLEFNRLTDLTSYENLPTGYAISYPFVATSNVWSTVTIDNNFAYPDGNLSESNTRVYSNIINPMPVGANTYSKEGLYIIKRTYPDLIDENSTDSQTKYFIIILDRSNIYDIDASTVSVDSQGNKTYSIDYYFENGSGTSIVLGVNGTPITLDAVDIQAYKNNNATLSFTSKRLPMRLTLPQDKYNTYQALNMLSTLNLTDETIDETTIRNIALNNSSSQKFKLTATLSYAKDNNSIVQTIASTLDNTNYTQYFDINSAGRYTLNIKASTDGENEYSYNLVFNVENSTPQAIFTSTVNHTNIGSSSVVNSEGTTKTVSFNNINDNELFLEIEDYKTTFESRINLSNIVLNYENQSYTIAISYDGEKYVMTSNGQDVSNSLDVTQQSDRTKYVIDMYAVCGNQEGNYSATIYYYDTNNSTTLNVVVDRTKPTINLNKLISYDKWSDTQIDTSTYFLAMPNDFEFENNNSALETQNIYIRKIADVTANGSMPDYTQTVDFNPTDKTFTALNWSLLDKNDNDNIYIAEILQTANMTDSGYYEIVEADQAGNYTIYAFIIINDTALEPQYNFSYTNLNSETVNSFTLPNKDAVVTDDPSSPILWSSNNSVEIKAKELQFTAIDTAYTSMFVDPWQKIIIRRGDNNAVVYTITLDPTQYGMNANYNDLMDRFNQAISAIEQDDSKTCYNYIITITNRFGDDFTIQYKIPTAKLSLGIQQISNNLFEVTIPVDTVVGGETVITKFNVYKFSQNSWQEITRDDENKSISHSPAGNTKYRFGVGMYRFYTQDNFGRETTVYYGFGVAYNYEYSYSGIAQEIEDTTYTAGMVTTTYTSDTYTSYIDFYDGTAWITYNSAMNNIYTRNTEISIVQADSTTRKIVFNLKQNTELTSVTIRLRLVANGITDQGQSVVVSKTFCITHELQDIILKNNGDQVISGISHDRNNPTELSEDVKITWEDGLFGASVNLTRTYYDENLQRDVTETINNIPKDYTISNVGLYKIEITNGLGYTSNDKTLYIRRYEADMITYAVVGVSSNGAEQRLNASPYLSSYNGNPVYVFYAPSRYTQIVYEGSDTIDSNSYILIRTNKNNNLQVEKVDDTVPNLYRIYGAGSSGSERYIQIILVPESNNILNYFELLDMDLSAPIYNYEDSVLKITSNTGVQVSFSGFNPVEITAGETNMGNIISAKYYFNNVYIDTISSLNEINTVLLSTTGLHSFEFYDLAGNQQMFGSSNRLNFYIVNSVLFTTNDQTPIDGRIYNEDVLITLTNRSQGSNLYDQATPTIVATRNGVEFTPEKIEASNTFAWKFSGQGRYKITITSKVADYLNPLQTKEISTTYTFTIINPNQAVSFMSISQSLGFTITKVTKGVNTNYPLTDTHSLILSSTTSGNDMYTVYVSAPVEGYNTTFDFSFQVWINDEVPAIASSIDFGTATTDIITITFNKNIIYGQIGESYITITGLSTPIEINTETSTENVRTSVQISMIGDTWIRIYTKDGNLVASYKVTRNEPLNTTAIIVISIAVVAVIVAIILFIVLRRRLRVR